MIELSVLIPARNEEWLSRTVDDLFENIQGNTEVIVVLDGYIPEKSLNTYPNLTVIYHPEAVGQRIATNDAAKIASGKYLMKVDAHCAFDKGFDVKMLEAYKKLDDNVTMVPVMKNLHVFDWVCEDGHRRYQGRSGACIECGKPNKKDCVWIPKASPNSFTFRFDSTMHFQYWGELAKREENRRGVLTNNGTYDPQLRETFSIQGSCFMCTKERYFYLEICGEEFNSWGQQGVEVAMKTWMSGGRVVSNLNTWYAHMFRTQGGDFGFPYHNEQSKINENRELSRELFKNDKWPKAVKTFKSIIDYFKPPEWIDTKGIIFYTDNQLDENVAKQVREKLLSISKDKNIPIVSSSLKGMDFGVKNVRFPSLKRGYKTMFKQILGALENSKSEIIFFTEHDVLYHTSHFDFVPTDKNTFYYNQNVWFLRSTDGHALHYDVNQLSGLCGYRDQLIQHFKERYSLVEEKEKELSPEEFSGWVRHMGFEPMTHNRIDWKSKFRCETWKSEFPNIDIKHGGNLTGQRWKKEQYRNQNLLINWRESNIIEGWGDTQEIIKIFK